LLDAQNSIKFPALGKKTFCNLKTNARPIFASKYVRISQDLLYGQVLTRRDIAALFGGNARAFLPRLSSGEIVAGCFDPRVNPRAPFEVLVHSSPNAIANAKRLVRQGRPVPVFIKREPNVWEYRGRFHAVRYSTSRRLVGSRIYEIRPRVYEKHVREYGEMRGILFLEEAE
jgi:hypothetical protein